MLANLTMRENETYLDAMDLYCGNANGVAASITGGTNGGNGERGQQWKRKEDEEKKREEALLQ